MPATSAELGGKGKNLDRLGRAGLLVPPWFCVTATALEALVAPVRLRFAEPLARLHAARPGDFAALSAELRAAALAGQLAPGDEAEILARFDALFGPGAFVAVRSSALGEDSAKSSYAGQMESYLWIDRQHLIARVKDCASSVFSERALAYRSIRGEDNREVRAAVVVQRMVASRSSGILFTANPMSGNPDQAVVSAALGLGEGVVTDRVDSDTFIIDRQTRAVLTSDVRDKRTQVVFDAAAGTGTHLVAVPAGQANLPALTDRELTELVAQGETIARALGGPQDVEWAFDETGLLWFTQTRPITTLPRGTERIFDNSNIIEGYPGVTTPLTFSFARMGYEVVFRGLARAFGVPEKTLAREASVLANMIGIIDGRMYYNLLNFYRFYSFVPGFERNLEAWKKAVNLDQKDPTIKAKLGLRERLAWLPAQLKVAMRIVRNFVTLPAEIRAFERRFEGILATFHSRSLDEMSADELMDLTDELIEQTVHHWDCTVVNDLFAVNFFDILRKLIARWQLDDGRGLVNALLCGEAGMESVAPVRSLLLLTQRFRDEPALAALLASTPDDRAVWQATQTDPRHADFRSAARAHLEKYSDRTVQELKLEVPGLDERPHYLVTLCRSYLTAGRQLEGLQRHEAEVRAGAERRVAERLGRNPLKRALFAFVCANTRTMVKNRENTRFARTRAFGMAKRIYRALGQRFVEQRLIEEPLDIFYLTAEEIAGYIRGGAVTRSLRRLVALRKEEFAAYRRREPPARVRTRGIVYANSLSAKVAAGPPPRPGGGEVLELTGHGCSPGLVQAPARVLLEPGRETEISGCILVAPSTDPGWIFLMVAAQALVVERGSPLSHSAIVGRELGIPTVVGVTGATQAILDGEVIEVDGAAGVVRIRRAAANQAIDQPVGESRLA